MTTLIPKLRFSEFSDEWENIEFGNIADKNIKWSFTGGPFGSDLKSSDYTENGIRVIQLQNMGDGVFINENKIFTSEKKANQLLGCNIYPNEIILSKMGDPVARACIIPSFHERFLMCSDGIRLVVDKNKFSNYFVFLSINGENFRNEALTKSTGSTRKRIGLSELKEITIHFPKLPEQTKIANFLTAVDEKIKALKEKKRLLEEYKKGLMQQIFSQQLRFKNDDGADFDDWKEKSFGEIGEVKMCRRIFNEETSPVGEIPFFKIGSFGKKADAFISKKLYLEYRKKYPFPKTGDILISAAGTIGRTVVYNGEDSYYQDSNIVWIDNDNTKVFNEFLYYIFQIVKYSTEGGTIQRLYNNILKSTKFSSPSLPEQQKIANFLTAIDEKIEKVSLQITATETYKKGLLQQMFV